MTMWTDEDPLKVYPNSTAAWTKFQSCFFSINDLTKDANVFEMYLWQALCEFMEDNVQYMEMRSLIQQVSVNTDFFFKHSLDESTKIVLKEATGYTLKHY